MPSAAGNGDFSGSEDATGAAGGASRRRMSGSGVGAFSARAGASSPLHGASSQAPGAVSASDSWLVQKLKHEWSSCELGPLLTKERLADTLASFPHLDTPIKVRLLLAFLSMRKEDFEANKFAVVEIVAAAEKDSEEWVKVGAGIVNQYLFMSRDGAESGTFLHEQLARASASVLDAVRKTTLKATAAHDGDATRVVVIEDFFCHENAYLSASVRPELAVQPAAHFTIAADAPNNGNRHGNSSSHSSSASASASVAASSTSTSSASSAITNSHGANKSKPPMQRPQLGRPLSHGGSAVSAATSASSSSSIPMRMASTSKPPSLPPKKNMSELSSEIRRKADAGRFKRQRSRISVIDIDEVKQIESEKAQKAEEQKKRLKATKDDKKSGSSAAGNGSGAGGVDGAGVGEGNGDKHDGHGNSDDDGAHDSQMQESQYSEQDDHHDSDREADDASYHGGQDDAHHRHRRSGSSSGGYAPQDGTQALLHAAFHAGDVMKDVVVQQQHQQPQYQHQQHDYYNPPRQSSAAAPPQQPLYSGRGFEPDDAHGGYGSNNAYAYGSGGYGAQFGDQAPPYNDAHQYGATNNGGFAEDQAAGQQGSSTRYDNTRDRGFLDGPPEYWR